MKFFRITEIIKIHQSGEHLFKKNSSISVKTVSFMELSFDTCLVIPLKTPLVFVLPDSEQKNSFQKHLEEIF